jgi:serine-type D-Ala-D-Ala carboxypeptidase (penicillin-binding protein 5/6)
MPGEWTAVEHVRVVRSEPAAPFMEVGPGSAGPHLARVGPSVSFSGGALVLNTRHVRVTRQAATIGRHGLADPQIPSRPSLDAHRPRTAAARAMTDGPERRDAGANAGHQAGPPRRRETSRRRLTMIGAALVVVLACALAFVIAGRPASRHAWVTGTSGSRPPAGSADARLVPALPATTALPGKVPQLPWPSTGQATVQVDGVGSLGGTRDQRPVPIASIAKVMTAYLILRNHPMNASDDGARLTVTKAEAAAYATEAADNESLVKVAADEVLTQRQALQALLLPSADNMARILARWDAGTIPAFVSKMNATAAALGMTNTHYSDPSGYEPATRSTASDQVLLATQALRQPAFAQIVAMPTASIPIEGTIQNYNTLLGTDGVTGIKTGSTSWAGGCLLFSAHRPVGGRTTTIIGAVLGQQGTSMHGLPQALSAGARLIETTASGLATYTPLKAGQKVATLAGTDLVATTDITLVGWPGLPYRLTPIITNAAAGPKPKPGTLIGRLQLDAAQQHQTTDLIAR